MEFNHWQTETSRLSSLHSSNGHLQTHTDSDEESDEKKDHVWAEISPKGRFARSHEELGRGAYKIVYKGIDNQTGNEVAWNTVQLSKLPKADQVRIAAEIDMIKKLNYKNIIQFISAWKNNEL